jgi:ACS family hexuronate transporter-like MFS transporter
VEYSALVNGFLLAYTVGQALTGRLVDALGVRVAFAAFVVWWSIAGMLHATAGGVVTLWLYRFLLGLGEAGSWPASMRAVFEWFPLRERSLAVGIFGSGTAIGALVSVPLVAALTLSFGWRSTFLISGLIGFAWLALWWVVYQPPERHPWLSDEQRAKVLSERPPEIADDASVGFMTLLAHPKAWAVMLGRLSVDPVWLFYVFWLPNYLRNERDFSLAAIGLFAWIPFLTADLGNLFGGWLSGHLIRRGHALGRARKTVLGLGAFGAVLGVPAGLVESTTACLTLVSAATFAIGLWTTNAMTLNADIAPPAAVGRMTGLSGVGSGIGSITFTAVIGWLVDHVSYVPVFWLAGLLPIVGFTLLSWLGGDLERIVLAPVPPDGGPAPSEASSPS